MVTGQKKRRESRVEGRGSRVEGRGSRVEGRGSRVEGRGSRVEGRGSRVERRGSGAASPCVGFHPLPVGQGEPEVPVFRAQKNRSHPGRRECHPLAGECRPDLAVLSGHQTWPTAHGLCRPERVQGLRSRHRASPGDGRSDTRRPCERARSFYRVQRRPRGELCRANIGGLSSGPLHYWKNEAATAEVDFLWQYPQGDILPLEVKSGINPKSKSPQIYPESGD